MVSSGSSYVCIVMFAIALPQSAAAAPRPAPPPAPAPAPALTLRTTISRPADNRPLPPGEKAFIVHAPYGAGDCAFCHASANRQNPGPVTRKGNETCLECHEEFAEIMARKHRHAPAITSCVSCHNPHDAKQPKLLHKEASAACLDCHTGMNTLTQRFKVKHGALTTGRKCLDCHNPHASQIEKLLIALPYDLCVGCHGTDGITDWKGVRLTNFKKLLQENPVMHAPIASKDCSACHQTHGADTFRLLVAEYPAKFYAPYDVSNYSLCFGCHNDEVASSAKTSTMTGFRDGTRNLHFLHVNKSDRGRTCRACHEVHASKQDHHLRDAVPYGSKGWMLKIGYQKTPTGGTCAKTCHDAKTYVNTPTTASK